MGQKINPVGFRLAVNRNWSSRWYANSKNFAPMLAEDIKVRGFLKSKLAHASVGRVLIERPAKDARITIFSARPGVVIGIKVWVYKGEVLPKGELPSILPGAAPVSQPEAPAEPKRAKKPAPRPGAKRGERGGAARPRPEGDKRAAPRKEGAPAPKTTVKRPKKVVKEEPAKPEGEKKE